MDQEGERVDRRPNGAAACVGRASALLQPSLIESIREGAPSACIHAEH